MNTQQLWQAQALDAPRISLAFVRHQSDALRRRTQIHSAFNYICGGAGTTYFVWKSVSVSSVEPLLSAAIALWAAAALIAFLLTCKHVASQERPAEFGVLDALKFHRRQLERQRNARSGGLRWSPLLFLPGHILFFASLFVELAPIPWKAIIFYAVLFPFGTWMAIVMADRSARRFQKEIDALDSL
ncbi:MAG: hypothetical protein ABI769_00590 [Pseudomonadota bacterium]